LAIIGLWIDSPEAGAADIGQPWTKSVAQESEKPKDDIAVGSSISHDLGRLQFGLLLKHHSEQDQAVAQGAGHGDAVQAGKLVGCKVVIRHAGANAKILRIGSSVHRADRPTNRMPSAEATSPPPHACASGI